jgi:hypothetical protein
MTTKSPQNDPDAEAKFMAINEAYEVLKGIVRNIFELVMLCLTLLRSDGSSNPK